MRWLMLVLLCVSSIPLYARAEMDCPAHSKAPAEKELSGFILRFTPVNELNNSASGNGCRAQLLDPQHKQIFSAAGSRVSAVVVDKDVNGDGSPDLVLESYSGEWLHCCWTYYIISLGSGPRLLKEIRNERGAAFVRNSRTGRVEIDTEDGAFDYLFLSHAEAPFPSVYLRLDRTTLVDVGREHLADYDREIKHAKERLSGPEIQEFHSAKNGNAAWGKQSNRQTAAKVLQIVYGYLYSGRQTQAHQAVTEMWPRFDQQRMWKLILKTRRKGILRYTRQRVLKRTAGMAVPHDRSITVPRY